MKMDIEGAEYAALQGMKWVLKENHDIKIISEFWPNGLNQAGASPVQFLQEARSLGFTTYRWHGTSPQKVSDDQILDETTGNRYVNLVLSRRELS